MQLSCRLAEIRGERSIAAMARLAGVERSYLSQIEAGRMLPRDAWIPGIERAYGISIAAAYETFAVSSNGGRMLVELVEDAA